MNENNLPNIEGEENTTPVTEETAEETADEVFEAAEEILEDVLEDVVDEENGLSEEDIEFVTQQVEEFAETQKAKGGAGKVVAIVIVVIAILAAAGFGVFKYLTRNPYNEMGYINVSGRTIEEVAAQAGLGLDEFLAEYSLPADMPADTEESAAYYNIPLSKIAEMYGMDTAAIKEMLGLGDDVTDTTPWGEAEGKAPLSKYIGEENLEAFKAEYGLGEEVTGETLWGEIRNTVDAKTLEMQQQAAAEAEAGADAETADDTQTDADANAEGGAETEQAAE